MTSSTARRVPPHRTGLAVAAGVAAAGVIAGMAPTSHAAPITSTIPAAASPLQADLVTLGYLAAAQANGKPSAAQATALHHLQFDRCMDADGVADTRTLAQVRGQLVALQGALRVPATGHGDAATRQAISAWQAAHHLTSDGVAGPAVMKGLSVRRARACGSGVVGDPTAGSRAVPCAPGTRDLGVHEGWAKGHSVGIRLCAVPGWRSTSSESVPGTRYYVRGANRDVVVNSRASGAYLGLFLVARNSGRTLAANSSYRTMAHQKALCAANRGCRRGDYTLVMRPGFSNHQLGGAVDVAGLSVHGSCKVPARQPASPLWGLLQRNAARFGIHQYPVESWHWEVRATGC